jgi:hypothetical protein
MKSWMPVWALFTTILLISVTVTFSATLGASLGVIGAEMVVGFLAVAALPILWQIYRVAEFRHFVSTTRFGVLTLESDASARTVIWITVTYLLVLGAAMLGVAIVLGFLFFDNFGSISDMVENELLGGLGLIVAPLTVLIVYVVVTELYLRRRLWAHYAGSISLTNTSQLASIIQRAGQDGGAFGDSFDPGFDIAG